MLALFLMLSAQAAFAEGDNSLKKGVDDIYRGVTEVGRAVGAALKKGFDEVNKTADKALKKNGKDKKEQKDKKDRNNAAGN